MKTLSFDDVLAARLSRRAFVGVAAAGASLAACAGIPTQPVASSRYSPFNGISPQTNDAFVIADGYRHQVVARWGDSLAEDTPDFDTRRMTSNDWLDAAAVAAQSRQFGSNCDAVQYFPVLRGRAARGLACVNHEYFSGELVWQGHHGTGMHLEDRRRWMEAHPFAAKFMQTAHGVSVVELQREDGWHIDKSSRFNRRITSLTPMDIAGPARGHALLRTRADPAGTRVIGTFANCSAGKTPWGTYLTCEENVDDYFAGARSALDAAKDPALADAMRRFPFREYSFYGWDHQDARFDMRNEPHEPLRFGWVVEIDPHDPKSVPRKRTALGRFQHEAANPILGKSGHVATYMGDDDKFEYIYKFVTRDRFDAKHPAANRDLLDHGTLYCARFDDDGSGEWLPLVHDEKGPLNSGAGFTSQGDVVLKVRAAADLLGATPMDRPEDIEPSPITGRIYIACTMSADRGGTQTHWSGRVVSAGLNAANPRPDNRSGHIIEITEAGDDATATRFRWDVFLLAGDPAVGRFIVDAKDLAPGKVGSEDTYAAGFPDRTQIARLHCPDNLGIDPQGRLWIVSDTDDHGRPNNGCFVVPTSGADRGLLRQLASGPTGCEVCGCEFTPDGRTLFLSIQHPGEGGTLENPRSHWPDGSGLPARSTLLAIEREDGAPV